jgi:hypothetical protein
MDVLRVAGGDGRLSAGELDTRLQSALSARTLGELTELTADRPRARSRRQRHTHGRATRRQVRTGGTLAGTRISSSARMNAGYA